MNNLKTSQCFSRLWLQAKELFTAIDAWNEASQLQVTTAKPGGTVINLSAADRLGAHILEEATADKANSMVAPL